jgi:pimeloyl-ACP methyl ester carboxylesterase
MNAKFPVQNQRSGKWIKRMALFVLVLVVATLGSGAAAKSILIRRNPAPGQFVDVNGNMMHIFCVGEGSPTVILEAGLDDFSIFWSQVQSEVSTFTRVCSYDRAGLGWSEASSDPRSSGNMVNELHTLLVNYRIEPPYVIAGHSFGGALMRLFAYDYPDAVAGIILIDATPDDLFLRIPQWRNAIDEKNRFFKVLARLSSFGLMALVPGNIPNRGLPNDVLDEYRAVVASTGHFKTGIEENEAFENNLTEIRVEHIDLVDLPLSVISRGYWDPMPGFSSAENQQAWRTWQEMQAEFLTLSSNNKQVIAEQSEHSIQLQQPDLVIDGIREMVNADRE